MSEGFEFNFKLQVMTWYVIFILIFSCYGNHVISAEAEVSPAVLLVSTLDGRINAISLEDSSLQWSVPLGSGGLVSSNFPVFQSTEDEQDVHIIPSLDGGLYEFSGRYLKPLLITPDTLLSTSYRLSDRIVVVGARTSELFGLRLSDGHVLYRCTHESCSGQLKQDGITDSGILAVRKTILILRAIDIQTGLERWNYSVGSHDIHLVSYSDSYFRDRLISQTDSTDNLDYNFKMQLGSNMVEIEKSGGDLGSKPWSYLNPTRKKFALATPIAKAWLVAGDNNLRDIDFINEGGDESQDPYVLLNQFDGHPYVHQSAAIASYFNNLALVTNPRFSLGAKNLAWHQEPLLLTADLRTPLIKPMGDSDTRALALYSKPYPFDEYPDGVIYKAKSTCPPRFDDQKPPDRSILLIWFGVVIFAFLVCVVTVVIIKIMRRVKPTPSPEITKTCQVPTEISSGASFDNELEDVSTVSNSFSKSSSVNGVIASEISSPSTLTQSRYATDFAHMNNLGKGGFGVVYRAKNKIDNVEYAVKVVPIKISQQKRAQREVRSWALLDHVNVVRFYQAWFEESIPVPYSAQRKDRNVSGTSTTDDNFATESSGTHAMPSTFTSDGVAFLNQHTDELFLPKNSTQASSSSIVFASKENIECSTVFKAGRSDDTSESSEDENSTSSSEQRISRSDEPKIEAAPSSLLYLCIQAQLCDMTLRDWIDGDLGSKIICNNYSALHDNLTDERGLLIDLFCQLLCGLDHIHSRSIIHRDIKPTNIFLCQNGSLLKIGDFGLASWDSMGADAPSSALRSYPGYEPSEASSEHFTGSARMGTQLYMSPEQDRLGGHVKTLTAKVDIFSSGLVGLELFVPFATGHERIDSITSAKKLTTTAPLPSFLAEFAKRFPSLKALIVDQMLRYSPRDRPTAEEALNNPLFTGSWRIQMHKNANSSGANGRNSFTSPSVANDSSS